MRLTRLKLCMLWGLVAVGGCHQLETRVCQKEKVGERVGRKEVDSRLTAMADRMKKVLEEEECLSFTAELHREWQMGGKSGSRFYRAEVEMRPGAIRTLVYEPVQEVADRELTIWASRPIEEETAGEQYDGLVSVVVTMGNPDDCLFGNLVKSWLGPKPAVPPLSFTRCLEEGKWLGEKEANGHICDVVVCLVDEIEADGEYFRREDEVWVDRQTGLPVLWLGKQYGTRNAEPEMVSTHLYHNLTTDCRQLLAKGE